MAHELKAGSRIFILIEYANYITMKKINILLFVLGIVLFSSCSLDTGNGDYSPQLTINSVYLNRVAISAFDTMKVGDTLSISLTANGVSQPLTSVQVANDTLNSTLSFPNIELLNPSILNNGKTNVSKGYFYFSGLGIYSFLFQVKYIVTKPSAGSGLSFLVASTSMYSPMTYKIPLPSK